MAQLDTINLDFQVLSTADPKILVVIDTSVWGFIEDKHSIIEIVTPGTEKIVTYSFVKGKTNVFNSSNLLLSPLGVYNDLPDGIYRITVKGSPDTNCVHRDFLKTDKARLELDELYINLGTDITRKNIELKQELLDIDCLIRAAEALVRRGKLKKGYSFFKKAIRYINDYKECEKNRECQHKL